MPFSPYLICVTTSKYGQKVSFSNDVSSTIQFIDPQTGLILSEAGISLGRGVGLRTLSLFPTHLFNCSVNNGLVMLGCDECKGNDDTTFAFLLSTSTNPSVIWKCRLPEYMSGGINVSPPDTDGRYIIGGGKSGICYCWSSFQNGILLKQWLAHYRPVSCITFCENGQFIVTGGEDGVVNLWSLMDVVDKDSPSNADSSIPLNPIRTWSEHQLGILSLCPLPSSRLITTSSDRHLKIVELFSSKELASIIMPCSITSVKSNKGGHILYAGGSNGIIYSIDVDLYAIAKSAEGCSVIMTSDSIKLNASAESNNAKINYTSNTTKSYLSSPLINESCGAVKKFLTEFKGHSNSISSLEVIEEKCYGESYRNIVDVKLVSSGLDGTVRVWDTRTQCCISIIRPWSLLSNSNKVDKPSVVEKDIVKSSGLVHPYTPLYSPTFPSSSLIIVPRYLVVKEKPRHIMLNDTISWCYHVAKRNEGEISSLIKPLKRTRINPQLCNSYKSRSSENDNDLDYVVPFMKAHRN